MDKLNPEKQIENAGRRIMSIEHDVDKLDSAWITLWNAAETGSHSEVAHVLFAIHSILGAIEFNKNDLQTAKIDVLIARKFTDQARRKFREAQHER